MTIDAGLQCYVNCAPPSPIVFGPASYIQVSSMWNGLDYTNYPRNSIMVGSIVLFALAKVGVPFARASSCMSTVFGDISRYVYWIRRPVS